MYKVWHWLPNLQPKKHNYFWLRLAFFSLSGHLILLAVVLGSQKRANISLTVFSKPRGIEVVFVPLYKKVATAQNKINQAKQTQAAVKTTVQNDIKKKQPAIAKKEPKKAVQKLPVKKLPAKTNSTKKLEKKDQVKKDIPKKAVLKIKDLETKVKPEVKPEPVTNLAKSVEKSSVQAVLPVEPIYIGRQDLKELQMFGDLELVLIQNWQPPVGFGSDVECIVELISGASGEIISLEIKKSSNILAYDLSVRRNFNGMILPKSAANKTFTIVFKP